MATSYKVLAQAAPAATTNTDVYTSPAGTQSVISSVILCNRSATAATYRIAVRPAGAAIANQHYIAYGVILAASDSTTLTLGITLAASDIVTVYVSHADTSVSLFGSQIA